MTKFCRVLFLIAFAFFAKLDVIAGEAERAVQAAGSPASLKFLIGLNLSKEIDSAIAEDIRSLGPENAQKKIFDRLRLNLIGEGVIDSSLAAKSNSPAAHSEQDAGVVVNPASAFAFRRAAAIMARSRSLNDENAELRSAFPVSGVISTTNAIFGKQSALLQTNPGHPIDETTKRPTHMRENIKTKSVFGAAPSQAFPGTAAYQLKDCDKTFETLKNSCGTAIDGKRCETFSRSGFPEVAKITTPTGGICSGTAIAGNWILTAAHCFLPKLSARSFFNAYSDRRTANDDAQIVGNDLNQAQLHVPYANLPDSRLPIERVIVHGKWDPDIKIASGSDIRVGDTTIPADLIYPGDLALIKVAGSVVLGPLMQAALPTAPFAGEITTAGYGVTSVGSGNAGELWVTWPEPNVVATEGQLELRFKNSIGETKESKLVSTFCVGDSGGPAFTNRHRGCQLKDTYERPRTVIGVTSYYYGFLSDEQTSASTAAGYCQTAPVMRFVDLSVTENLKWICKVTNNTANGCVKS